MKPGWRDDRVLVLGSRGMLGQELNARAEALLASSGGSVVGMDIDECDITDPSAVIRTMREVSPAVVINAAAYTDVDGCESNVDLAMRANAEAPGHLAGACAQAGATLVHFSTDFIFDGELRRPYRPDDEANPLSAYGRSKWQGEEAIRGSGCRHLIVRTSWLFGAGGRNFVEAILNKAEAGEQLRVVTDQVGRPTLTTDLVDAVIRLFDIDATGTVHFANDGHCSWFEYAQEIVRQAGIDTDVQPTAADALSRPARRPAYSVLDLEDYVQRTGVRPPHWKDALGRYLKDRTHRQLVSPGA